MAVFKYLARDDGGRQVEGEVTASSTSEAARIVRGEGKFVVKLTPKSAARGAPGRESGARKPAAPRAASNRYRPDDLIFFTNQLAVMIETGVSMSEALEACVHDGNSPRFARVLDEVIERVEGGGEFSASLAEHPDVFPSIYVSLVKASEASGMMAPLLRRIADHLEAQRDLKKKIKGAVTYPAVMFLFAIGVTVFLLTFVLPKFNNIYAGREDKLPVITRYLLSFSDFIVVGGPYLLGGLAIAVGGLVWYLRRPEGRLKLESLRFRVPLLGPMYHKAYLSRSLRTLGTMIQSGVSMLDGVQLTAASCGSRRYEQMWHSIGERLETGQQISEALDDFENVPRAVRKMLYAGERSGQLGKVMERIAIFCEAELNAAIKAFTSMLEPAIVMFLGVVVGGLVLALLLPIFTISKAMH